MDSKQVNKAIRKVIHPLLKDHGFTICTQRRAWRHSHSKIDVINFQSFNSFDAALLKCTTFSFAVNLGVYFKCVPERFSEIQEKSGVSYPKDYECHFRKPLLKGLLQKELLRKSIWYIEPDGGNLEPVLHDVEDELIVQAFPWFGRFEDMNEILRTLLEDEEALEGTFGSGKNPSPIRSYQTAYIALTMGNLELAKIAFEKAIKSGCFHTSSLQADYEALLLTGRV